MYYYQFYLELEKTCLLLELNSISSNSFVSKKDWNNDLKIIKIIIIIIYHFFQYYYTVNSLLELCYFKKNRGVKYPITIGKNLPLPSAELKLIEVVHQS